MADVRLTATNPDDSSVVPVACDAAGRLLLEEPQVIEGPPGPPGEQGPPGQDGQDGDPFTGNFAGDVTFEGTATFAGKIDVGDYTSTQGVTIRDGGSVRVKRPTSATSGAFMVQNETGTVGQWLNNSVFVTGGNAQLDDANIQLDGRDGSATFAGNNVAIRADGKVDSKHSYVVTRPSADGDVFVYRAADETGNAFFTVTRNHLYFGGSQAFNGNGGTIKLNTNGSAEFAGNKAGFTAEGYLWCTTERGDTVMLQATVGGAGLWVDYTPTTRLEELRDKLDANRGDTGEMPTDTQ